MNPTSLVLSSVTTERLRQLAEVWVRETRANPPAHAVVIGLTGTLGAGKTTLTQQLCRAWGLDASEVTSPTFTLLHTHRNDSVVIHHLDAYRLRDADEFWELGVDECWQSPGSWTIVEWADRVADELPAQTLWVNLALDALSASPDAPRTLTFHTLDADVAGSIASVVGALG